MNSNRIWRTWTKRRVIRIVWLNSTGYLLQLFKIGIFWPVFLLSPHPTCCWCWTKPYVEKLRTVDAELAGHAHKLDMKLQKLCGRGFSLFAVRMLVKPHHLDEVNWPTTIWKNKNGVHFFALDFECHNRYNKFLLCNSENGDIAWCNKNNSEWAFCVFVEKRRKPVSFW